MFSLTIILLVIIAGTCILCLLACAPKVFEDTLRDVLIFAAHSDDCVIVGAEYACGALDHGHSVRIVYLTCSGPDVETEISQTRRLEAIGAWSNLSVTATNLTFIDLCESAIGGPTNYTDKEIELARRIFTSSILALPQHAAVIIPASGELHVDHRTVRQLAFEALRDSKRTDLIVYESPEYNGHLSLLRTPERTMRVILRYIPLLNRLIAPYTGNAGYIEGSAGFYFHDPVRLAKKKELLMNFTSQDGRALVGYFGHPTPYRVIDLSNSKSEADHRVGFHAFGHLCDLSALAFGFSVGSTIFLITCVISDVISKALSPPLAFNLIVGILGMLGGCVYVARAVCRRVSAETAMFACAGCFGLVITIILKGIIP